MDQQINNYPIMEMKFHSVVGEIFRLMEDIHERKKLNIRINHKLDELYCIVKTQLHNMKLDNSPESHKIRNSLESSLLELERNKLTESREVFKDLSLIKKDLDFLLINYCNILGRYNVLLELREGL